METLALYQYADDRDIDVDWFLLSRAESLSAELPDGHCVIAIDPSKLRSAAEHKVKLAHELGHCERGAFYNPASPWDIRQRHENKANKWAIQKLIPEDELQAAVADGCTEVWDLAERFGVTEDFMRKAICWYRYGSRDTSAYY